MLSATTPRHLRPLFLQAGKACAATNRPLQRFVAGLSVSSKAQGSLNFGGQKVILGSAHNRTPQCHTTTTHQSFFQKLWVCEHSNAFTAPSRSAQLLEREPQFFGSQLFRGLESASERPRFMMAAAYEGSSGPKERKLSKVAVAQMLSTGDIEANFRSVKKLVEDAAIAGCSMLFLPESFSFIGLKGSEGVAIAEPLDGPLMQRYCQLARENGIWLSLGGFQEKSSEPNRLHNTHVIVNDAGEITAVYRKIHLFDVDVPNGPTLLESASTAPGCEMVVTDSPAGRLGVTTCYDLRFPQFYQQLRFKMGAEIILVPSAFTKTTGEAHWEVLLRARAIECQCYVIAAAQAGRHNEKRESFGDAIIVDPWGRIVARLDDPLAVGIATADIDLAAMQAIRTSMPVAQHRRYDIYGEAPEKEASAVRSTL